jgi:hypothetical protein
MPDPAEQSNVVDPVDHEIATVSPALHVAAVDGLVAS